MFRTFPSVKQRAGVGMPSPPGRALLGALAVGVVQAVCDGVDLAGAGVGGGAP